MKIAFIVNLFPALSETFILNQITGLIDRGHDVKIFAFRLGDNRKLHKEIEKYKLMDRLRIIEIPKSNFGILIKSFLILFRNFLNYPTLIHRVYNFSKKERRKSLRTLCALSPFLKDGGFDIFHCHFGPNGSFAVDLCNLLKNKVKIVTVFHGYDMTTYIKNHGDRVYENLFNHGDFFLPITERWKKKIIDMGCSENRIKVHRMGIDLTKFQFKIRKKVTNEPIKILTVGRLVEKKGIEYGIKAVSKLIHAYPQMNILYEIVGDGPLMDHFRKIIGTLNCDRNIKLLGWQNQDEISELMSKAHIFLAPSVTSSTGDQEGLPVVLMESLANGLIVCSTFHSGIPELIIDGENGFLVSERNIKELVKKLKYIIDCSADWAGINRKGYEIIKRDYNIDILNDRLIKIFQTLSN